MSVLDSFSFTYQGMLGLSSCGGAFFFFGRNIMPRRLGRRLKRR